jgi:hypothetical protein
MSFLPYSESTGTSVTNINIDNVILNYNNTNVVITFLANNLSSVNSYRYKLNKVTYNYAIAAVPIASETPIITDTVVNVGNASFTLTRGSYYKFYAQSFTGAGATGSSGNQISYTFWLPGTSSAASIIDTVKVLSPGTFSPSDLGNTTVSNEKQPNFAPSGYTLPSSYIKASKSLFKLTQPTTDKYSYTVAYKLFSQLNTAKSYYSFGTTMFFDSTVEKPINSGGFGFFISNDGMDGYFVQIETSDSAAASKQKEFKIYRVVGGNRTLLEDSQQIKAKTLTGIFGGQSYKVDITVAVDSTKRFITAYVNGFKITATDSVVSKMLPVTKNVAMICNKGSTYFDYVYGMHLDADSYNKEYLFNVYQGKYPNNLISFLYGQKTTVGDPAIDATNGGFIEEFGAVARELRVLKTKYESRPAFPLYASVGINQFAQIVGQRLTSSGAEVYVINNSGTYIPLDDSEYYSFYILGKYVSQSGQLEYSETSVGDYTSKEPVIFNSDWIQKNSDVLDLANWIKNIWSKKQTLVTMEVFGNPLICVGDVIGINYPYNGMNIPNKFLVTSVNHSFSEGLETTITCRTL